MQNYQHIDLSLMNSLFSGEINFKKEILVEYNELISKELIALKEAIAQQQFQQIRRLAHKVRPTCSYMGMRRAHNLSTNYMKTYDADETTEGDVLLGMARALMQELRNALDELQQEEVQVNQLIAKDYSAQAMV